MHGNLITFDYYNKWRSGWITFGCRTLTWQTQSAPTFTQPHSLNRVPRLSLKFTHHLFHSMAKIKFTSLDAYSSIHRLSEAGPNSICLNNVFFCRSIQAVCFNTGWEWINNGDYKDINGDYKAMTKNIWKVRLSLRTSCPMDLHTFPFDSQQCSVFIQSYSMSAKKVGCQSWDEWKWPDDLGSHHNVKRSCRSWWDDKPETFCGESL